MEEIKQDGQTEPEDQSSTIPDFIANVLTKARAQEDADEKLLDILENRIVHNQPIVASPQLALADIEALAEKRVKDTDKKESP